MIFAPHILQKKVVAEPQQDEFGRPVPGSDSASWVNICSCRCDDNDTKEFVSANGIVYRPNHHIVCEGNVPLREGDEIRCMEGNEERGAGKVFRVKGMNFFGYSEIWV